MKFKSLILGCFFSLCSTAFAANLHIHPETDNAGIQPAVNAVERAGSCEIEIINQSYNNVRVFGEFDDGSSLQPFNVYSFESPHYISLFYYGYCHPGMDLYIETFNGDYVYSSYTRRKTTVRIVPYLTNQVKAEVQAK